jgi:hypothetical protein
VRASRRRRCELTTIPHEEPRRSGWAARLAIPELWASLAIASMWLAVLFDAVYGPSIVVVDSPTSSTTIPSAVAVAVFAWLGSAAVARYGFARRGDG